MFLHKGLHFRSLNDMLGYALIDDAYIIHSEEYVNGDGQFECSNGHSLNKLNEVYSDFSNFYDEPTFDVETYFDLA